MKPKTKTILLITGFFIVAVLSLAAYGGYRIYSFFSAAINREIPEALKEGRVTHGNDLLTRTEFFKLENSGWIKIIGEGSTIEDQKEREKVTSARIARGFYNFSDLKVIGNEVIAAGEFGGFVFDLEGKLKKEIAFEPTTERIKIGPFEQDTQRTSLDNLRIVRLDAQRTGFLSFGSLQGVRIFDGDGRQIWTKGAEDVDLAALLKDSEAEYEKSTHVLEAAVGDLNNDGISEYVVARKNDGLRAYTQAGEEKWFHPDEFPSSRLEVFDLDGDGSGELVEIGKQVRDRSGKVIRPLKGFDSDAFLFVQNGGPEFEVQSAKISEGRLKYETENGGVLFDAIAPLAEIKTKPERVDVPGHPEMSFTDDSETVAFPRAVWVKLWKDKPRYLAVVASFIGLPRSNFYVYDEKGNLTYHELLSEDAETLSILPLDDGTEQILIGGKETIWKYAPK